MDRAFSAVATALHNDPLVADFAKPGREVEFVCCLLHALRQRVRFSIFEAGTFCAVALMRDTEEEGFEGLAVPTVKDSEVGSLRAFPAILLIN